VAHDYDVSAMRREISTRMLLMSVLKGMLSTYTNGFKQILYFKCCCFIRCVQYMCFLLILNILVTVSYVLYTTDDQSFLLRNFSLNGQNLFILDRDQNNLNVFYNTSVKYKSMNVYDLLLCKYVNT